MDVKEASNDTRADGEQGDPDSRLELRLKSVDMNDDMQKEVVATARKAMSEYTVERDIAREIKRLADERWGPTWHCIVGRNFGSYVTHEKNYFAYFYLGPQAILLFKTQ